MSKMDIVFGEDVQPLYPNVMVTIERITPETAEMMLAKNIRNRSPKREALVQAMKRGEWMMNGETIVFGDDGRLLDGQNRLMACVSSGATIDSVIVRGVKTESQLTMDQGIKRQFSDELRMRGMKDVNKLQSITIGIMRTDEYGLGVRNNGLANRGITIPALVKFFDDNYRSRIKPIVPHVRSICKRYRGVPTGDLAGLLDILKSGASPDDYMAYVMQLDWSLDATGTIALLKKRLIDNSMSKTGRLPGFVVIALMVKAWNAYITGDELMTLRFRQGGARPEEFPEVVIPDWREK